MRRSRLLQDLKPFFLRWLTQGAEAGLTVQEGPDIDLVGGYQVGRGGDKPLLFHADGSPVSEFDTIAAALAAMSSGDVVQPQAGTYAETITVPAGGVLAGRGAATVITGTVTGGAGATMRNLTVKIDGDDAGLLYGVAGPASGEFVIEDCRVEVDNATGNAAALYSDGEGTIKTRECLLRGVSAAGSGYAAYRTATGGAGTLIGGELQYNTTPVYEG